jgi:hypothetical protein
VLSVSGSLTSGIEREENPKIEAAMSHARRELELPAAGEGRCEDARIGTHGVRLMSQLKRQGFCRACNRNVLATRQVGVSDGMGCLLSVLTAGLFLPVFLIWRLFEALFQRFRGPECGSGL